jgi:hypothetical protein
MNPPISTQRCLYDVARRIGLVPEGSNANLDPDKAYELLGFIDDRLQEAWQLYDWIETTFIEQRAFRPDFDQAACYAQGDIVWDPSSQQYYQALAQTIGGPLSNSALWMPNPSTVSPRWVPWWQDGKTPIGVCYGAWTKNPYEDKTAIRVDFGISSRGIEFTATSNLASVWLVFRIPYPGIGRTEWDSTVPYNKADAVIDGLDTYICAADGTVGKQPSMSPDYWTRFRVPYCMARYTIQAAFSDSLVVEGQNEKAPAELNKAYGYLQMSYDQQELQQGQLEKWRGYSGR